MVFLESKQGALDDGQADGREEKRPGRRGGEDGDEAVFYKVVCGMMGTG